MRSKLVLLALAFAASGALAEEARAPRGRRYSSPEYPAIRDAPPAAGTTIGAPGTRLTNESSAETAAGITGDGPRARTREKR